MRPITLLAVAAVLMVAAAPVATAHTSPAWKPPVLTVTNPSSGGVDLAWVNVPGTEAVLFTYTPSNPCQFGCETIHPNTGELMIDNPNSVGGTFGYQVCSTTDPQACTNRVWLTVQ